MNVGILQRYLISIIIKSTLVILLMAFSVDLFIEFSNEIKNIGNGGYTVYKALLYIPMIIPSDLYTLFPMIGLLGVLIGLGALASNNELLVMRASGLSLYNIVQAVLISALFIGLFSLLVGEVLAPKLSLYAKNIKQSAITGNEMVQTQEGTWLHIGQDFINIARILDRSHWINVRRYHFDEHNKLLTESWASVVEYHQNQWLASSVSETRLFDNHIEAKELSSQIWPISLTPNALAYGFDDAEQMTLLKLHEFIHYRIQAQLPLNRYPLNFWQRVFQPLAMLVMMLLAIPFVFVSSRSGTLGVRILIGVMLSLGFYLINQLFGQLSLVYQASAFLGAFFPIAIFLLISIYGLRRVK